MKNNITGKCLAVALVLACFLACCSTVTATTITPTSLSVDYTSTATDKDMEPGDSGILLIVIQNSGGLDAKSVTASIFDSNYIESEVHQKYIGNINPSSTVTLATKIKVSTSAPQGSHILRLTLNYDAYYYNIASTLVKESLSTSWDIPVSVGGKPSFAIENLQGINAGKGDSFRMSFNLKNEKNTAYDASVSLSGASSTTTASSYDITVLGSNVKYIGDIGPESSAKVEFDAYVSDGAESGAYLLPLTVTYEDQNHVENQERYFIGVYVSTRADEVLDITNIDCSPSSPGSNADLTLSVKNVGEDTVEGITVDLDLSSPLIALQSDKAYISSLEGMEEKDVSFRISISSDANIKTYTVPVNLIYTDMDGAHTIRRNIGVQVYAEPDISVGIDRIAPGEITIRLVNLGLAEAKFLNVRVLPTDMYDLASSEEIYIGNMDPDDYDTVEYDIKLKAGGDVEVPLKMTVEYLDAHNNKYSVNKSVTLSRYMVESLKVDSSGNTTTTAAAVIILAVVGFLGYRYYKKRQSE